MSESIEKGMLVRKTSNECRMPGFSLFEHWTKIRQYTANEI